ncbi:MAG: C4-dicarboxylate ABC transporter substrate-binding protein [Rhodospirillales bacterium]|nr:C4-dicarboxylate ABC transporter substrate-binding protein [Rhodospirillales bacterium]MDH3909841.1 C4-dicarboxylate ABC transporter substrate-binding protein [Rhodospirillales bacterium]MDH3966240.1 C4-dicarboxylate ABC transporter substrate-binding protein [Rhodospirillales bacterium]
MKRLDMAALGVAAMLALCLASQKAEAADALHKWKMAASWGGGPLMEIGSKAFAEKAGLLTDGRVQIEVFPAGKLGPPLEVTKTVREGAAEVGHTWMGLDWTQDKTAVLFGGFAGSMDPERTIHWLYEGGGLSLWREFREEKFGVVSMPGLMRTAEVFLHSRKPVRSLADLKGLKVRTAGAWLEIVVSLGATSVSLPHSEVKGALAADEIDAAEWGTLWENAGLGVSQITKYVIVPGVHQPVAPFELQFNKAAWNALSERDKRLIEVAAKLVTLESWIRFGQEDAKALDHYRQAGNEILALDDAFQAEAKKAARAWAEEQAKENTWFAKVWKSQQDFEALWKDAPLYRDLRS